MKPALELDKKLELKVTADDLTFAGLDDQKKKVQDLFALKQLTQKEEAEQLIVIASKKGALAKKETQDQRLVQSQQIAALDYLKQAFTEFNDAQSQLIDGATEEVTKQNTLAKDSATIAMDNLTQQKTATANAITGIQNSYNGMFDSLNVQYTNNKTAWDASMKAIADGMDPQIKSIIDRYAPLEATLDRLARKQSGIGVTTQYNLPAAANGNPWSLAAVQSYNIPTAHFAEGGTVTGGRKGHDSVAARLMPGEEVLNPNTGLGERLNKFLSGRMSFGSGSVTNNQQYINVNVNNPVVRNDTDIHQIARQVSNIISRGV